MTAHRFRPFEAAIDAVAFAAALVLAYALRFDGQIPGRYLLQLRQIIVAVVVVKLAVFYLAGVYDKWWRYASAKEMSKLIFATILSAFVVAGGLYFLVHPPEPGGALPPIERMVGFISQLRVPRSITLIDFLLTFAFVGGWRFLLRLIFERRVISAVRKGAPVLIVGAGDAGEIVVRDLLKNPDSGRNPIGFLDDDPRKRNMSVHGVRVVGTTAEIPQVIDKYPAKQAIIAMPSAARSRVRDIVFELERHGIECLTIPGLWELVSGQVSVSQLRDVQVEDVLGRDPVDVDLEAAAAFVAGRTVMVTGAGGSIGSELCRQIAAARPDRLILLDHAELALFSVEHELTHERHVEGVIPVLADIKNVMRIGTVFERYRPDIVFHAAAYKHVPLMEANPEEAVKNNLIGTRVVAEAAARYGAERFVFVSTDKAVNPQTVMGASKAMAEQLIRALAARDGSGPAFIIVRFGNVLGSSGSVVPIFRRQIARGGPVTVTHPEMTRFFMTIPEAVSLVVQAGAIGTGGEVFVLDMGEPMRILDLAYNMIRLSGLEPDKDVRIEFIGVRPGEKLAEELFAQGESTQPTAHPKIVRAESGPVAADEVLATVAALEELANSGDSEGIVAKLAEALPTFVDRFEQESKTSAAGAASTSPPMASPRLPSA